MRSIFLVVKQKEKTIPKKLLNPHALEALTSLSEEGLVSLNPMLEKLMNELMKLERERAIEANPYERTEERKKIL